MSALVRGGGGSFSVVASWCDPSFESHKGLVENWQWRD
jgi:hypothetical protein